MATLAQLETIYRRNGPIMLRRALAILGDLLEAQDVVQEIFLRLIRNPERLHIQTDPLTFLYRSTTNASLNRLRDAANRQRLLDQNSAVMPNGPARAQSTSSDPEAEMRLRELLSRLPEEHGLVVALFYFDHLTHAEIAEVVGCSRRKIGYMLEDAKRHLHSVEAEVSCSN